MTSEEQRQIFKNYRREYERIYNILQNDQTSISLLRLPDFPKECLGMICGAKSRAGTPCKRKDLHKNGRCRLHGGLSTGPKTLEGKRKSALNTGKTYEELIENKV